jgi:hypothetical protein
MRRWGKRTSTATRYELVWGRRVLILLTPRGWCLWLPRPLRLLTRRRILR